MNSLDAISTECENDATAVDSDGTNSCAFLGLEIANQFLASQEPKTTAEDVISNYPVVINQLRNKELYEPIAAYSLMRNNNLINNCTLSEEFVDEETQRVFSFAGRDHFVRVLVRFAQMLSYGVGLYTYANHTHFLLASIGNRFSLLILIQLAVLWVVTGTAFYSTLKIQMQLRARAWFVGKWPWM